MKPTITPQVLGGTRPCALNLEICFYETIELSTIETASLSALTEIPWTPHVQRVLASQFQAPAGYPREPEQVDLVRTMATRLKVPAVVSHSSAGVVHELPLPVRISRMSAVHVTVSRLDIRPSRRGLNVHVGEISPCDYQEFNGIPVTSSHRVIADLAHLLTLPELNVLLDQAMNHSWKHYRVHFGEQFTQDQVNDLLAQVLSRRRFHGRRNVMQLIEFRKRFNFPDFDQPWQSYVSTVISAGYRVSSTLNTKNHSTEEFVTLRCHGYHTVILTWTDLLSDQWILHQYGSTRYGSTRQLTNPYVQRTISRRPEQALSSQPTLPATALSVFC